MKEKMRILVVEPVKRPYVKEIDHTLEEMQKVVGGSIQALYPFEDRVGLICNDEAKIAGGFTPNRALRDENGNVYDKIFGTFFIAGLGEEDFCSLEDDLIEKFHKYYEYPQLFGFCGSEEEQKRIRQIIDLYTLHLIIPAFIFNLIPVFIRNIKHLTIINDNSYRKFFQKPEDSPGRSKIHTDFIERISFAIRYFSTIIRHQNSTELFHF